MKRFWLSPLAKSDLAAIRHHIRQDKPMAADRQIARFFEVFQALAANSALGQKRPEMGPNLRSFCVGSYVVFYRPRKQGVEIARVMSGYRDIDSLMTLRQE
jgi:toxin ParE1/3/4